MTMFRQAVLAASLVAACGLAQAVQPGVSGLTPGYTFQEYSGAAPVGNGQVDVNSVLWYIDEQQVAGFKSYYIFFDPKLQQVSATLTFEGTISAVFTTKSSLDGTNATYGIDVDHDSVFDDYSTNKYIGLEAGQDTVSWAGNSLTLHFRAYDPGDHIRVLVAVPEPSTYALFGAGIAALGFLARRRKPQR
jgi:hypothetical protein